MAEISKGQVKRKVPPTVSWYREKRCYCKQCPHPCNGREPHPAGTAWRELSLVTTAFSPKTKQTTTTKKKAPRNFCLSRFLIFISGISSLNLHFKRSNFAPVITITSATVYLICHLNGCFVCLFFIIMHWRIVKRIRFKDRSSSDQHKHKHKQSAILIFFFLQRDQRHVSEVLGTLGFSWQWLQFRNTEYILCLSMSPLRKNRILNLANCSLSTHVCVAEIFTNKLAWGITTFYVKLTVSIF